jgi:hypothetical protein
MVDLTSSLQTSFWNPISCIEFSMVHITIVDVGYVNTYKTVQK